MRLLIEPGASVNGHDQRRRARLLAAFLLPFCGTVVALLVVSRLSPDGGSEIGNWLLAASLCVYLLSYGLSRTRLHVVGASVFVTWLSVAVVTSTILVPDPHIVLYSVPYLAGVVMFVALIGSFRMTVAIAVIVLLGLALIGSVRPDTRADLVVTMPFILMSIALNFVSSRLHARDLREVEAERHLSRSIIDQAPSLIYVKDLQHRYVRINKAMREALGKPESEIIGKTELDMGSPPEVVNEIWERESRAAGGEPINMEIPTFYHDVARYWHVVKSPLVENGEVSGVVVIAHDVTAMRQLEEAVQVEQASKMASAKLASLGEMAAGIAHEINNPLAIIQGKAQQLGRLDLLTADPERVRQGLETIQKTASRIDKIVRGMRALARDSSADPPSLVPIRGAAADALLLFQERLRSHGIKLESDEMEAGEAGDTIVSVRPSQIAQVLINLLNNAFDAVDGSTDAWIRLRFDADDKTARMIVENSGRPILPGLREKIFQPFFTTKEAGKGTGIGLSISLRIAQDHGGDLIYDALSPFPRFDLILPRKPAE